MVISVLKGVIKVKNMKNKSEMPFTIKYDRKKGFFDIRLFEKKIIGERLGARIGKHRAVLLDHSHKSSSDQDGAYQRWEFHYASGKNRKKTFKCWVTIRSGYAIFETRPDFEIKEKPGKYRYGDPYIAFPCFEGDIFEAGLSCLSYKRQVPFNYPVMWQGKITDSLREGKNVPLIAMTNSFETLVISPLNKQLFNSVAISHQPERISCGLPRGAGKIKRGSKIATILVYGVGVNKTLDCWGELLRRYHGVAPIPKDSDILLEKMSYWTNAGSAYWYNTYKKTTYEKTLRKLKDYHQSISLNFGSYQMDSWWYKKEGDLYTSGIVEWEPKSATRGKNFNSVFAWARHHKKVDLFEKNKLSYVQSFLQKPLGCHFKQLARDSLYYKNNPDDFIVDNFPIPKNKKVATNLFIELFNHPRWNLAYVIHDWLSYMNDNHKAFKDPKVTKDYFTALNQAARQIEAPANKRGFLSIQYCMALPNMVLDSVRMESVTTIRATSDSNSFMVEGTKRWWWNLYSSRLITALGKYPFYDNRYSCKNHRHPFAPYSQFEFIWIGLSCGPLGIGDKIGKENVALIRRCVLDDGKIIKPDVPAMPLDKCFLYNPHTLKNDKGVAVYSYSTIPAISSDGVARDYRVAYLLVYNPHPLGAKVGFSLTQSDLPELDGEEFVVLDYYTRKVRKTRKNEMLNYTLRRRDFHYELIAPLIDGVAVFGDGAKHVALSAMLVKGIGFAKTRTDITINYAPKQDVATYLVYLEKQPLKVTIDGWDIDFHYRDRLLVVTMDWSKIPGEPSSRCLSVFY